MGPWLRETAAGVVLSLKVQPRSARNQLAGLQGDELKLKLTAPPVDGAANRCCCDFLAQLLQISGSRVELIGGATSRHKKVLIRGLSEQQVRGRLGSRD